MNMRFNWTLRDGWTMSLRNMKHMLRNPEALLLSVGLPVILMILFVVIFGGVVQTGTDYVNYVFPGVITICVGFASSLTAIGVTQDMTGGLFERLRSMPLSTSSLLTGHVTGSFLTNVISTALVILVALLVGFRPAADLAGWLAAIGILCLFILAMSWLAVVIGLLARSVESSSAFTYSIMFLPYISSAFVPLDTLPDWLHGFAKYQPMTPLIETVRALLFGQPLGSYLGITLIWFGGLLLISAAAAVIVFNKKKRE